MPRGDADAAELPAIVRVLRRAESGTPPLTVEGEFVTTPDHAENTGDNLRHAAEVQESAKDEQTDASPEEAVSTNPPPDFNT